MNDAIYGAIFFGTFIGLVWGMTLLAPLPTRKRTLSRTASNRIGPIVHPSVQRGTILAVASTAPQSQTSPSLIGTEWRGEIAQADGEHRKRSFGPLLSRLR